MGTIGFIGAGNMAKAIIQAILRKKLYTADRIGIYDHHSSHYPWFTKHGVQAMEDEKKLARFSDIIILSVKPQNYDNVLHQIRGVSDSKTIVSIAAGISSTFIKERLGKDTKVVLVMPNTPLSLGEGATAICRCLPTSDDEFSAIKAVFASGGVVQELPEKLMNAVISVNGSSPAYVYLFAKSVIDGAVKQGIDAETAKSLICQVLIGSAKMLIHSDKSLDELIQAVSSKGGTTIAALDQLYAHNFESAIVDAMDHCTKRAEELGK
ncbi:MAG TPA: pyrroline-5-carboxylate reductase [Ruminococcaceae bacterium]|nr:pyrroline-5-carboxylate reductase [Oscillospiraceae bacterium]